MKIKKVYQGELPENKILNAQSTSQTDTYSCEYINGLGTKNYIQAALNSNVTLESATAGESGTTQIQFNKITKSGTMFEITNEYGIKVNSNGKSGRLKLHMHASFMASGTPIDSAFISIKQMPVGDIYGVEVGQINMGLFGAESRNSGTIDVIVEYNDGDIFYVYGGAYGTTVTLLASLNRTLLLMEEI